MNFWSLEVIEKDISMLPYRTVASHKYEGFKTRIDAEEMFMQMQFDKARNTELIAFVVAPWGNVFVVDMHDAPSTMKQYILASVEDLGTRYL